MEKDLRMIASVVESSTDLIGFASIEGSELFMNPAGRQMLGIGLDEPLTGASVAEHVMDEDREGFRERVLPIVARDGRWEGENAIQAPEDRRADPMWQSIFFITEQGTNRRIAMATICRDITERKREEHYQRLAAEILGVLNEPLSVRDAITTNPGGNQAGNGLRRGGDSTKKRDDFHTLSRTDSLPIFCLPKIR